MRRRPTIPLADWRIAVDLEATRAMQNRPGTPAYGCECTTCTMWRRRWREVLPNELAHGLERVGIEIDFPSEAYESFTTSNGTHCRLVFHCIGELQSGPNTWRQNADGEEEPYHTQLRADPHFIYMAVYPHRHGILQVPVNPPWVSGQLIQIDMRVHLPADANQAPRQTQGS